MTEPSLPEPFARWCVRELGEEARELRRLAGGNSNETFLLVTDAGKRIVRKPPAAAISASAHAMERELTILSALARTDVPAAAPLGFCADPEVLGAPFLVQAFVDGVAVLDRLPAAYPADAASARAVGEALIVALAALHRAPWRELGLEGFGRPDGFLERQVARWRGQYAQVQVRDLPEFDAVADWLERARPPASEPAILHGDYHLDNVLLSPAPPARVLAIVDWELSTIGDPLLDLGLMLAFWGGERPDRPAFPPVQAISRVPGAPSRQELAGRYAALTGRSVDHLEYYLALALWKLAAIVEGAYAQYLRGEQDTAYARGLEQDVPALLREAAGFAGLS